MCLAPAVAMLGYYALEYVPSQREYFMNLRFRALAIIGDQVRSKVERLATSLDYATMSDSPPAEYISALVPELNYLEDRCVPSRQPSVEFGNPANMVRFHAGRGCPAEASLPKIFSRFVRDDLFDDVVLADATGRVIYQRSTSSPKIVNLTELAKAAPDTKPPLREGNGSDADAVRRVRLDDSEYALLIQPVGISLAGVGPVRLTACGLVRSARLAEESRHVPPVYLLVVFTPLVILLLSGPFLKILLLTRTGRLAFRDLAFLGLCTLIATSLSTLAFASWHQYAFRAGQAEPNLEQFADSLNRQIVSDVNGMRSTLEQFDAELPAGIATLPHPDRTDLLAAAHPTPATAGAAPFDFVFWTNARGCQIAKWTTKRFNTQRVDQTPEEHFQNVLAKRFWFLENDPAKQFTLQTLVSPTTSQLIVVMAIPSRHANMQVKGCGNAAPSRIVSTAIVAPLPAVSSPLVPPGSGFAVFESSGQVLFHSSPERNLHENLFEEIRSPGPLRAAVAMHATQSLPAYYRGRKYEFHVRPLTGLGATPWHLAVFRELEPQQALSGIVWGEALFLFLGLLCLLVVAGCLLSLSLRARWRRQVDAFLAAIWPAPARRPVFRRLAWEFAAMAAVSMIVVSYGIADAYRSSGWLLPFCYLVPFAAVGLAWFQLRKPAPASWDTPPAGQRQPVYIACLTLSLVLTAVVPTLGLFGVCRAFESRLCLMRWQQELAKSADARRTRLAASIEGSPAFSDRAKAVLRERFLSAAGAANAWDRQHYAAHFWQTTIGAGQALTHVPEPAWWQSMLALVRAETQTDAFEAGALARDQATAGACHWHRAPAAPSRLILSCDAGPGTTVEIASTLPAAGFPATPLAWISGLILLGLAYAWNHMAFGRLYMLDFLYTPLPQLTGLGAPATLQSHILLLGLPLAHKDHAVRQWLGYTPARVNLYAARFTEDWLEDTTTRLEHELTSASRTVVQTAGGGTTVQSSRAASVQPWVHISNLEAKLGDPQDRQVVAGLLERLILMEVAGMRVRLIVTSAVDPVFHFDSVLSDERKKIYEHPLPEPELQRLARLLHNFRKVQVPGPNATPPRWALTAAGKTIYAECRHHEALLTVGEEVAACAPAGSSRGALVAMIAERARALYKLFWSCCTRSEKLLLIQLAQTGLFNPLCTDTLEALIRKGLILPGPRPRIMNETFESFLATVEGPDTVRAWEKEAGESSWLVIRNVVLGLMVLGLILMALTQRQAMQTVTAVVTGVGAAMAGLLRLTGYFTGRRAVAPEAE
jgi:hypothetical protein